MPRDPYYLQSIPRTERSAHLRLVHRLLSDPQGHHPRAATEVLGTIRMVDVNLPQPLAGTPSCRAVHGPIRERELLLRLVCITLPAPSRAAKCQSGPDRGEAAPEKVRHLKEMTPNRKGNAVARPGAGFPFQSKRNAAPFGAAMRGSGNPRDYFFSPISMNRSAMRWNSC